MRSRERLPRRNSKLGDSISEKLTISAHDTVQDNVFPAVFRIGGEVSVLFQGIFEHLAVCTGKHTAVIVNYKRLEIDAVFFVDIP